MFKTFRIIFTLVCISIIFSGLAFCRQSHDNSDKPRTLSGPYLGQEPPGKLPAVFAPGIVSTEKSESGAAFSPDGKELFFCVYESKKNTILTMKEVNGKWTKPQTASFSGEYNDVDPYFSLDGNRLYFSSYRPLEGKGKPKDSDFWYIEKISEYKWSEPYLFIEVKTRDKDDYYSVFTKDGSLYFSIFNSHNIGHIYKSEFLNGNYSEPEYLKYNINSNGSEHDPFISPDEDYLIFTSDRKGGFGRNDLYISFHNHNGKWSEPKNLGKTINTEGYEYCPMLSSDGRYLFFTRHLEGNGDIYWVDAKIINNYRPTK